MGRERGIAGTGLGLVLAWQIVEAQGGTIGFDSEEGGGSTVWFRLPSASPAGPETDVSERSLVAAHDGSEARHWVQLGAVPGRAAQEASLTPETHPADVDHGTERLPLGRGPGATERKSLPGRGNLLARTGSAGEATRRRDDGVQVCAAIEQLEPYSTGLESVLRHLRHHFPCLALELRAAPRRSRSRVRPLADRGDRRR